MLLVLLLLASQPAFAEPNRKIQSLPVVAPPETSAIVVEFAAAIKGAKLDKLEDAAGGIKKKEKSKEEVKEENFDTNVGF